MDWIKNLKLLLALVLGSLLFCAGIASCSGKQKGVVFPSSGDGDDDGPISTAVAPLKLKISSTYGSGAGDVEWEFDETGTTECVASTTDPQVDCTIHIPEGQLYYSQINLQFSRYTSACRFLVFIPYQYRASNDEFYFPPGSDTSDVTSATDCTKTIGSSDDPIECYGGAGRYLVDNFPQNYGNIYLPAVEDISAPDNVELTIESAYDLGAYSNRLTVNDMDLGLADENVVSPEQLGVGGAGPQDGWEVARALAGGVGNVGARSLASDGYVLNALGEPTYSDYTLSCYDEWYEGQPAALQYQIRFFIREENGDGADDDNNAVNDFFTWKERDAVGN